MTENRNILVFGDDWGYYPSTIQHIGRVFAKRNRLLWIGSLGMRKPALGLRDFRRAWQKGRKMLAGVQAVPAADVPNVIQIHPFALPLHDFRLVRALNAQTLRSAIKEKMHLLDFHDPVILTSSPLMADLLGTLGESSSHYICLDDFTLFDRAFDCILPMEQKLLEKVSSVFSVSDILVKSRIPRKGESHFLPQGVDTDHFKPSVEPLPPQVAGLRRPVIGFFGLLTSWVDLRLIVRVARQYPDTTVLVLGRTNVDVSVLATAPNVVYLGEVPYPELPRFARAFDVGLIPFIVNDLTKAANPLKLLEYLALGIPVVSTALPEAEKFRECVLIGQDDDEFVRAVGTALADTSPERGMRRREVALGYSWQSIAERISQVIVATEAAGKKEEYVARS